MPIFPAFCRPLKWAILPFCCLLAFIGPTQTATGQSLQITTQPISQTNSVGATVTFSIRASSGNGALHYRWLLNGITIPLAKSSDLVLTNVQGSDAGIYAVVVSDDKTAIISQPARLLVLVTLRRGQDLFKDATPLPTVDSNSRPILEDTMRGDNFGATSELGEPLHNGKKGGASVWYKWTAPVGLGIVTFTTAGSDFDTLLGAYTGTAVTNLTNVLSGDFDAEDQGGYLTSEIVFKAIGAQDYFIAVDGFAKATGNIVLKWKWTAFEALPVLGPRPHSQVFATNDPASVFVGYNNSASIAEGRWYFNGIDTGNTNNNFGFFAMDPTHVGTYYVGIRTLSGRKLRVAQADFQINTTVSNGIVSADTNQFMLDKFFDAIDKSTNGLTLNSSGTPGSSLSLESYSRAPEGIASGYTSTQIFSTSTSSHEPGEPNHCGIVGGSSQWFSYQPSTNGYSNPALRITTDGSTFPTILAIYTNTAPGNSFTNLVPIACDSGRGTNGLGSGVNFPAVSGALYFIVVDGVNGTNGTAKLNIALGDPISLSGPASQTVVASSNATFSASVTAGTGPVAYQWQTNGVSLPGATNSSYTVTNAQPASAGTYSVAVSNLVSLVTNSATLTVITPPVITIQPTNQTVVAGSDVTLFVGLTGSAPFTYQWRFNGGNIVGTNQTLVITNVQPANAGNYRVVITNLAGTVMNAAPVVLTVNYAPIITTQPVSRSVALSNNVALNVVAAGVPAPVYQWQRGGVNIGGASSATLTLTNFQKSDEGSYRVVVTNLLGSAISSNAVLFANSPTRFGSFGLTGGGGFQFQLIGISGSNYVFQASSNLVDWLPLLTNSDPNGLLFFTDLNASNFIRRFYRAKPGP